MQSRYLFFFMVVSSVVFPLTLLAKSEKKLRDAATYFHDHQYEEALHIWKSLEQNSANGNLYFNIGLAQSRLLHVPEAIYAFEQALRLNPGNADFKKALEIERKKMDDAVIPVAPFFLGEWFRIWISLFRPGLWAFLGLVLLIIGLWSGFSPNKLFSSKWAFKSRRTKGVFIAALVCLATAILSYAQLTKKDEAIVMQSCELHQASTLESPLLRQLSAGEKVIIKDKIGDWYYVSLLNLDYGWVDKQCLNIIKVEF